MLRDKLNNIIKPINSLFHFGDDEGNCHLSKYTSICHRSICHITLDNDTIHLWLKNGASVGIANNESNLEYIHESGYFFQADSSHIVNIDYIREVYRYSKNLFSIKVSHYPDMDILILEFDLHRLNRQLTNMGKRPIGIPI